MNTSTFVKYLCRFASRRFYSNGKLFPQNITVILRTRWNDDQWYFSNFGNPSYCQIRTAKRAIVKEGKGKHAKPKVHLNDEEMNEVIEVDRLKAELEHVLDKLRKDYADQLSIRTSSGAIESIEVEIEKDKYPLNQVAQISRKSPQLVVVNMGAFPEAVKPALQAIQNSGMNLTPQQDGTVIYIPVPKVTKEHRESLAKNAKLLLNKAKDEIRDIQNKFTREAKKQTDLSEDLVFNCQQQIKAMANEASALGEKLMQNKQKELLSVQ